MFFGPVPKSPVFPPGFSHISGKVQIFHQIFWPMIPMKPRIIFDCLQTDTIIYKSTRIFVMTAVLEKSTWIREIKQELFFKDILM